MLVIKIELWPYGLEEARETLAEARIANKGADGSGCRYLAEFTERGNEALDIPPLKTTVQVRGYDRRQSVWSLLRECISAMHAGRRG